MQGHSTPLMPGRKEGLNAKAPRRKELLNAKTPRR
jgi:hypothetical protein